MKTADWACIILTAKLYYENNTVYYFLKYSFTSLCSFVAHQTRPFPRKFARHRGKLSRKWGWAWEGVSPPLTLAIFVIFRFATSKSTVFKSLHKQKRY
jgi:hypothetical protein